MSGIIIQKTSYTFRSTMPTHNADTVSLNVYLSRE